jgi:hypothetical protein
VGGFFAQHVSPRGFTMAGRWLFGRSGASSTLKYNSGPIMFDDKLPINARNYAATISISENDTQSFSLKDKCFTAIIAELGYTAGRMQFYVGPGVAFHRQKLSCVNSSGKVAAGITKTVTSLMFALGTRYAMSNVYLLALNGNVILAAKRPGTMCLKSLQKACNLWCTNNKDE